VLLLVNFQDKAITVKTTSLYSYLGMETAKQVTLVSNDPWVLEIRIHGVGKGPARTSEVKWRQIICTRRG